MGANLDDLAARIEELSPSDRLRLAAELMDARRPVLAHTIAEKVVLELGAAVSLARRATGGRL